MYYVVVFVFKEIKDKNIQVNYKVKNRYITYISQNCLVQSNKIISFSFQLKVDEKERKDGNDPERELLDSFFQDYQRPLALF